MPDDRCEEVEDSGDIETAPTRQMDRNSEEASMDAMVLVTQYNTARCG